MSDKIEKDALERIRHARHEISKQFNHDPKRLIEYYIELQQLYKDRFVDSEEHQKNKQTA